METRCSAHQHPSFLKDNHQRENRYHHTAVCIELKLPPTQSNRKCGAKTECGKSSSPQAIIKERETRTPKQTV